MQAPSILDTSREEKCKNNGFWTSWARSKFQYLVHLFCIFRNRCFRAISNSNIWCMFFAFLKNAVLGPCQIALFGASFLHFPELVFWCRFRFHYLVHFFCNMFPIFLHFLSRIDDLVHFFAFFEIGVLGPFQIALFGACFLHFSNSVFGGRFKFHYLVHFFCIFQK